MDPSLPKAAPKIQRNTDVAPERVYQIGDFILMIRDRWLIGLSVGIILASVVAYYGLSQPPEYVANARLIVEAQTEKVMNIQQVVEAVPRDEAALDGHLQLLRSRAFVQEVASTLSDSLIRRLTEPYIAPNAVTPPAPLGVVLNGLVINRRERSFVIEIGFNHRDPELAAIVANRVAQQYLIYLVSRTESGNASAVNFLTARMDELKAEVGQKERELQAFLRENGLASLEDARQLISGRIQSLDGRLAALSLEEREMQRQRAAVGSAKGDLNQLRSIPAVAQYENLSQLFATLDQLQRERDVLSQRYLRNHPRMVNNAAEIKALFEQVNTRVEDAINNLEAGFREMFARKTNLQADLTAAERRSAELDQVEITVNNLRREIGSRENMLSQMSQRLTETAVASQLSSANVRLLEEALPNYYPVKPNKRSVIIAAMFLLLIGFVVMPIGMEFLNSKLHTQWDVQTFLARPLLGDLPLERRSNPVNLAQAAMKGDQATLMEGFRALYGQIAVSSNHDFPKSLLVTSTLPAEGKSFVSCNLAAVFASHGHRTLLIDTDFRRPTVHRYLELGNDRGLVRYWRERDLDTPPTLESIGVQHIRENLSVLPSGGKTNLTTEMFTHKDFPATLGLLLKQFDIIILDSPPAGVFPDAMILGKFVNEILFVNRHNTVPRTRVKRVIERLSQSDADILGLVFNGVDARGHGAYYQQSYYQYGDKKYRDYYQKESTAS